MNRFQRYRRWPSRPSAAARRRRAWRSSCPSSAFFPLAGPTVRDRGRIELPFGRGKTSPVAAADVARVVAAVLADPGPHLGRISYGEGWADEARTVPWTENTITCVFSTTKTMTSLAALVLVDRGALDLDANVAAYWPEFAARGKAGIRVRQLLSHTSGVSGWDQPVTLNDLYDWDKSTAMLAAQAPWWEPGAGSGYHALTYGHLIGEVIRRITGQRLGEFFAAQIAGPLGADFHIGLPSSEFHRIANVVPPPAMPTTPIALTQLDPNCPMFKTFTGPTMQADCSWSWTERWRRADIGAANGHGNVRSVARIQSAVACGGEVDGVRLLSPKTINRILEVQSNTVDRVLGIPLKIGVGYGLPWPQVLPFVPEGRQCFGTGAGGSLVIADVDRRMTIAYVMNKMVPVPVVGPIAAALVERVYDIVNR